ncbi:MAG: MliC family protein, partial [Bartonella sp.]|nr:MliC family protein [Bartonella sp.]
NVIAATGAKYAGAQYIWWEMNKEVTLYDLANDPEEKKPIICKDESLLLF